MRGVVLPYNSSRSPIVSALLDGSALPNVFEAEVSASAFFGAARFRVRMALDAYTASQLVQPGSIIDVRVSLGGPAVSLIQGEVDSIAMDVLNGTVELEGRDLTGRLLDARTQETFSNQTSSEIAETLAARHDLTPNVTATTALAGRYYGNEHDRITLGQFSRSTTEWDLLTFLAAREGFEVFVNGTTLNFVPLGNGTTSFGLTPQQCTSLNLEHSLALAGSIEVTVKSWNTRQQAAVMQTVNSSRSTGLGGSARQIMIVRPNLSSADALQLAQRILADLSAHERIVSVELPGELALSPRSNVTLSGTGTDFDQAYYVSELHRHYSLDHGFTESLRLKNMPPTNQSALAPSQ